MADMALPVEVEVVFERGPMRLGAFCWRYLAYEFASKLWDQYDGQYAVELWRVDSITSGGTLRSRIDVMHPRFGGTRAA